MSNAKVQHKDSTQKPNITLQREQHKHQDDNNYDEDYGDHCYHDDNSDGDGDHDYHHYHDHNTYNPYLV